MEMVTRRRPSREPCQVSGHGALSPRSRGLNIRADGQAYGAQKPRPGAVTVPLSPTPGWGACITIGRRSRIFPLFPRQPPTLRTHSRNQESNRPRASSRGRPCLHHITRVILGEAWHSARGDRVLREEEVVPQEGSVLNLKSSPIAGHPAGWLAPGANLAHPGWSAQSTSRPWQGCAAANSTGVVPWEEGN
jgi:hypothetical protein